MHRNPAPTRVLATWVVVAVLVALVAGCTESAVNASLERSTAPLLVPQGEWTEQFDFTAPPGSSDLYQLRWNFRAGATDVVTGWQVASSTTYDAAALAEGPGQEIVDEALRAARGEGCTIADRSTGLQHCTYDAEFARDGVNAYLVRLLQNHILVIDYTNPAGSRLDYNANSLDAQFINADFEPVPIDSAIDEYLVYIY